MYNNNFSSYGISSFGQSQGSQQINSQYQGNQRQYQPIGFVQSFYGNNAVQPNQSYGQAVSPSAYHTANYRGNEVGHDAYLRSDSWTPSQQQSGYQGGYSSPSIFSNNQISRQSYTPISYQTQQPFYSAYGSAVQANQPYSQNAVSPNAFHTASYRGNQPGHDNYLRSDSQTPAQQSFQTGYGTQGAMSYYNAGSPSQYGQTGQYGYNISH